MKFLLDENVDYRLAPFLKHSGHNVKAIPQDYPNGITDANVLALARKERRVLLTNDKDFGDLIFHRKLPHCGVILFRLKKGNIDLNVRKSKLRLVLDTHFHQLHHFLVISEEHIRIRKQEIRKAA